MKLFEPKAMCPLWLSVTARGWQAKLRGHAEGRASSFWATQSRLPFGLQGVDEFVFAMPGEIVGAARHWPAKELALKVLYRVSTGVLRDLDRIAEDDLVGAENLVHVMRPGGIR